MRRFMLPMLALFLFAQVAEAQPDDARLLRFPAIHGDQVAFTYAGDLYTASATGGVARKLTSHEGFEMFPRFSPDGKWLAFTGQYDGNTEVYVMPAQGGEPRRLTFTPTLGRDDVSDRMGPNNIVIGWTPDSKNILFRSRMKESNDFIGQLFTVPLRGGLPEQLPLPRGGFASYSPDGKKLAYNRIFREFRTWKRYRGGMCDEIWVHDFETRKTEAITDTDAQDIIPMWAGDKIYFLSDRDDKKRMNLYVYDFSTKRTRQLTEFTEFDIKFPSMGGRPGEEAIVFEYGGWLYRFDLKSEKSARIPIQVREDHAGSRGGLINVSKTIANFEISPDGKRALFGARGEIFTVPAANGPTRNLTNTSGVHERNSKWSPDGKWIAFVSDASGEDEIWIMPQDGSGKPTQLTTGGDTYKYEVLWSPDSTKILWSDKKLRLQFVDIVTRRTTLVAQMKVWETHDFAWSPDSKWIAYGQPELDGMARVYLYSVEQSKSWPVTDKWYASSQPAFSSDGKYLFFVSNRDFNPMYSRTEWNHAYQDMSRIYFVTLAKETPNPLKPKSDEVQIAQAASASPPKSGEAPTSVAILDAKADEPKAMKVDLDGLMDRILVLPIQTATYRNLASSGSVLYYVRQGTKDAKPALQMFDLASQKETALGNAGGFELSADRKKMIIARDGGGYSIIDAPKAPIGTPEALKIDGMEMTLDRKAEWRQIFHESWRQMRDFFYDPEMHKVDWQAMKKKYEVLLPHVNHRADLTYVIGEMIGELNAGHAYVGGGDWPKPQRIPLGMLGAELQLDEKSGYFQIKKILRGQNWDPSLRSPLTEVGVNASAGDFILAIDGKSTRDMVNPYEALIGKAGKQVVLRLNARPEEQGARDVAVIPIADEQKLYYYQWVQGNIKKVDEATGGKVGYIHVPDMLSYGLNEFVKHFYPQLRKKALIIDMRGNGGGNVSPMLIERLRREIVMFNIARNSQPITNPADMLWGPKVCLINEFSASDGDLFPWQFRHYQLGKLIGKRSWGGVVGIRGSLPFVDGGDLRKPEFSRYGLDGKTWIIEGHGVDPDIVVDNDPAKEFAGEDQQLDRAIKEILEELKTKENTIPPVPPGPDKRK